MLAENCRTLQGQHIVGQSNAGNGAFAQAAIGGAHDRHFQDRGQRRRSSTSLTGTFHLLNDEIVRPPRNAQESILVPDRRDHRVEEIIVVEKGR